ncbi:MFS transporter [Methylobacterium sp. NEAU 140]|uniref:MFS transporter n=1 Tax=Methylobacterium sp. NEAU 140 TaxID=3064945 RepID=UPI00273378D7|nr:MFS transporter [Methylobacterium sp. NEAU 140]MDP4024521.1 MFS transporter [Methylobacterium sp. NEAU 140]
MSDVADSPPPAATGRAAGSGARSGAGNVVRLAVAQALGGANSTVVFATGAVVGDMLAPSKTLATLPISIFVVGMSACTLPAGAIARRHGRGAAFMAGTGCGVLVGLLSAWAIVAANFWLFCAAMVFGGAYAAVVFTFRFAAADCVPAARRPRALSAVMAGGVFGGVIGPQLVTHTMNLWTPYLFAASFLAQAAVATLAAAVLSGVRLPRPPAESALGGRPQGRTEGRTEGCSEGRPMSEILRQPRFVVAVICGAVSYLLMNFVMTAAPLAMRLCGHAQEDANLGLQWHVIAMYAPSFVTGRLITRFGAPRVVAAGLVLIGASALVGLGGIDVAHFWLSLILLGLGWNFGFVGASALVLECHRPEERTRVQSVNDFIVFGTVALGSFSSGGLLTGYGWNTVLWVSFVPLALAVAALALSGRARRAPGL